MAQLVDNGHQFVQGLIRICRRGRHIRSPAVGDKKGLR